MRKKQIKDKRKDERKKLKHETKQNKQNKKPTVAAGRIKFDPSQSEAAFLNPSPSAVDNDLARFIQPVTNLVLICQLKAK